MDRLMDAPSLDNGHDVDATSLDNAGPIKGQVTCKCTKHLERIEARLESMETGVKGDLAAIKEYLRLLTMGKFVDPPPFSGHRDGSMDEGGQSGHNGGGFNRPDDPLIDGGADKEHQEPIVPPSQDGDKRMEEGYGGESDGDDSHMEASYENMSNGARRNSGQEDVVSENDEEQEQLTDVVIPFSRRNKSWYQSLLTPSQFTDDETIDTLFVFLQNKFQHASVNYCRQKFTTANSVLSHFFRRYDGLYEEMKQGKHPSELEHDWAKDKNISNYVMGELTYYTPWSEVDCVYMPFKIGSAHWVLVKIDMVEGKLIVWDSLILSTSDVALEHELEGVRTVIPALLYKGGVLRSRTTLPITPWPVHRVMSAPQGDCGDCGIFCAKFFECDVTGCSMDTLIQENMTFFRRQLTVQLWANTAFF